MGKGGPPAPHAPTRAAAREACARLALGRGAEGAAQRRERPLPFGRADGPVGQERFPAPSGAARCCASATRGGRGATAAASRGRGGAGGVAGERRGALPLEPSSQPVSLGPGLRLLQRGSSRALLRESPPPPSKRRFRSGRVAVAGPYGQ